MRKFVLASFSVVAIVAFAAAGVSWANRMHGEHTKVTLAAVPGVKTSASGDAVFTLSKDGKTLNYKLNVKKIENVTMGHVHAVGADGMPAEILVWIYPAKGTEPALKAGSFSGKLAEGAITADKLAGPLKGGSVRDLFEQIEHGKAGVALHTKQNGGGELWGANKATPEEKNESSGGSAPGY